MRLTFLTLALSTLTLPAGRAALAQTSDCNHLGRHLAEGVSNQVDSTPCPEQVSIQIPLYKFDSPASCPVYSYSRRPALFLCNGAQELPLVGKHCDPFGEKSNWVIRELPSGQSPCPQIAGTIYDLVAQIYGCSCLPPGAAATLGAIATCAPLPIADSGSDWSAFVRLCADPGGTTSGDGGWSLEAGLPAGSLGVFIGDPRPGAAGASGSPGPLAIAAAHWAPDFPATTPPAPATLPEFALLGAFHPALPSAQVDGTLTVRWYSGSATGGPAAERVESYSFSSWIHHSGLFADSRGVQFQRGEDGPMVQRQLAVHDGAYLYSGLEGTRTFEVTRARQDNPRWAAHLRDELFHLTLLQRWLLDPSGLASGLPLEIVPDEAGEPGWQAALHPVDGAPEPLRARFRWDASGQRIERVDFFDAHGRHGRRVRFGRYAELAPGCWRPLWIWIGVLSAADGELSHSVELRLGHAAPTQFEPERLELPANPSARWLIHEAL